MSHSVISFHHSITETDIHTANNRHILHCNSHNNIVDMSHTNYWMYLSFHQMNNSNLTMTSPFAGVCPPLTAGLPLAAAAAAARPAPAAGTGLVLPGFTAAPLTAVDVLPAGLSASAVTDLDFTVSAFCTSCHHLWPAQLQVMLQPIWQYHASTYSFHFTGLVFWTYHRSDRVPKENVLDFGTCYYKLDGFRFPLPTVSKHEREIFSNLVLENSGARARSIHSEP